MCGVRGLGIFLGWAARTNFAAMKQTAIALAALAITASSCRKESSADVAPAVPIYQDYKVTFDKPDNRTRAFATFRKHNSLGTRLELTGGSSITFNGNSFTSYTELDNYFYRWSANGMASVAFRYIKEDAGEFQNSIALADTFDVSIPSGIVLSTVNGGQVQWVGRQLEQGETLKAQLKQGSTHSSTVTVSTTGAQVVLLPASMVSAMAAGAADLYLTRTRTLNLQQADGSAGGRRVVEVEARGSVVVQ
jgi:hypothetical protein